MRDLKFAWRRLAQAPLFTLFSVATLALGIGVTTAAYSVLYPLLWRPPASPNPAEVVTISQKAGYSSYFSLPEFRELAAQQASFASLAAWYRVSTSLSGYGTARLVRGEAVTGQFFQVLGIEPVLGRTLQPDDDRPDAPAVVVLSESTWQTQFAADREVLGQSVRMAGHVLQIVGVMPPPASRWQRRSAPVDFWVPLDKAPQVGFAAGVSIDARAYRVLNVVARLRPSRSVESTDPELGTIAKRFEAIERLDTQLNQERRIWAAAAFAPATSQTEIEVGRIVLALPLLVLLIASTNLANLALSRGASRRHEFAVRRALGGSRLGIVREQLVEGLLVATAGGAAGVLVAKTLIVWLTATIERTFGMWAEFRIDARLEPAAILAAALAATLAFIVATLVPALQLTRSSVRSALASDTPAGAMPRWRGRSNLIALQVSASVGLFLIAALFVRGILSLELEESRVELDRVAMVSIPMGVQDADELSVRRKIDEIVAAVRRAPGVDRVAVASQIAGGREGSTLLRMAVTAPEKPFVARLYDGVGVNTSVATPELFAIRGLKLKCGRLFDATDDAASRPVAMIDESVARKVFGTVEAHGRELLVSRSIDRHGHYLREVDVERVLIIGVLEDVPDSRGRAQDLLYVPFAQQFDPNISILARGRDADVTPAVGALRAAVHEVDPDLAIGFAGRADVALRFGPAMFLGLLATGAFSLAGLALVLSMAGLYGVLSHVVARRTRELGLRIALGANSPRIIRLILRDGFRPVLEGAFVGLASAFLIRMAMQPYFSEATMPSVGSDRDCDRHRPALHRRRHRVLPARAACREGRSERRVAGFVDA